MSSKPLVVQTENLDAQAAAWLAERCELVVCPSDDPRFGDLLGQAEGLLIRTYTLVNDSLLTKAPRLRVVARAGVGLDNVDVAACARRSVVVVSTPGANTRAVVELVTSFMLDALRPRLNIQGSLDSKAWAATRKAQIAARQLCDLTLGIVGFGRVGSSIARVGAAMDMRMLYSDLLDIPADRRAGAAPASIEEICSQADVLTIHVDGRPENRHLIGAITARFKHDVIFINTSRGFVVDTTTLAAFLRSHPEATAYIDVHEPEPFGPDYPLLGLSNAHLTAHIGAATASAHANMSWVVKDLWRVLNGETPEYPTPR